MTAEIVLSGCLVATSGALAVALARIASLKKSNATYGRALEALKKNYIRLRNQKRISAAEMSMTIFRQQEQIDALSRKVAQQQQLLNQKWVAARTAFDKGGATDGR